MRHLKGLEHRHDLRDVVLLRPKRVRPCAGELPAQIALEGLPQLGCTRAHSRLNCVPAGYFKPSRDPRGVLV